MWVTIGQEQREVNKGIAREESAETLKTSGMGTKRAASSAQRITGAEQGTGRPGCTLAAGSRIKNIVNPPKEKLQTKGIQL